MAWRRSNNKYGAVKQTYNGYSYDSKKEAEYAAQLDWRKKAGEVKEWERQHKWDLYVEGKKICQYTIDFRVVNSDDTVDYIEVKGAQDYAFTIRWKLVQALFYLLTEGEKASLFLNEKKVKINLYD